MKSPLEPRRARQLNGEFLGVGEVESVRKIQNTTESPLKSIITNT